jgi:competence protein ComEA
MIMIGLAFSPASAAGPDVSTKLKTEKINLNTANIEELANLPGIGEKKAEAIVAYRTSNGPFASAEDLLKVKGVGDKLLEKIKPMLTVKAKGPDLPKSSR